MSPSDGQLLERFARGRDEAAFEALLARHGPMVLGVCRRVLGDATAAEDVFQATFLVLARRAAAIRRREVVGSWLYAVAHRLACKLRVGDRQRRERERRAAAQWPLVREPDDLLALVAWQELRPVLDEELGRLPDQLRAPLVLCYLEGMTHVEAARALGWPSGSLAKRLARGCAVLRERLTRRGLGFTAALVGTALAERTAAAVTPALLAATVRSAVAFLTDDHNPTLKAPVTRLAEGALRTMFWQQMRWAAVGLILAALVATGGIGLTGLAQPGGEGPAGGGQAVPKPAVAPAVDGTFIKAVQAPTGTLTLQTGSLCVLQFLRPPSHHQIGDQNVAQLANLGIQTHGPFGGGFGGGRGGGMPGMGGGAVNEGLMVLEGISPGRTVLSFWFNEPADPGKQRCRSIHLNVTREPGAERPTADKVLDGDLKALLWPGPVLKLERGQMQLLELGRDLRAIHRASNERNLLTIFQPGPRQLSLNAIGVGRTVLVLWFAPATPAEAAEGGAGGPAGFVPFDPKNPGDILLYQVEVGPAPGEPAGGGPPAQLGGGPAGVGGAAPAASQPPAAAVAKAMYQRLLQASNNKQHVADADQLLAWGRRVFDADLEAHTRQPDRIAAVEAYLTFLKDLEESAKGGGTAWKAAIQNKVLLEIQLHRTEAELILTRERSRSPANRNNPAR